MFHGNAGNIGHRLPIARMIINYTGCNVFMLEYRGYGLCLTNVLMSGTRHWDSRDLDKAAALFELEIKYPRITNEPLPKDFVRHGVDARGEAEGYHAQRARGVREAL